MNEFCADLNWFLEHYIPSEVSLFSADNQLLAAKQDNAHIVCSQNLLKTATRYFKLKAGDGLLSNDPLSGAASLYDFYFIQ
ncbi:MAG: hypothetical protein ACOYOK_11830, partial [Pseudobdellovibrionaceae bacterium]